MAGMNLSRKPWYQVLLLIAIVAAVSSCRTGRDITERRLKPMAAEKILNRARDNAYDFDNLTIRRINVQYSDGFSRTSFRANLKAVKDEKILASVFKLNIPLGRVLLTPENVTYVNYIDKNYFEGDYSYISNLIDFQLDFRTIQSIISNPVNTGIDEPGTANQKFETSVEDGLYVLEPARLFNNSVPEQRRMVIRNTRQKSLPGTNELEISKLMFNPQSFVVEKLVMTDPADGRRLEVDFRDFARIEGYNYPESIDVKMVSGKEITELNIKLKGLSAEKVDDLELNIPGSYQKVRPR